MVVIVDGYNDVPASFAADVELTLDTLRDDGVQHVLWVNLHEIRARVRAKNAVLAAAALHHPELRVLDWNAYSANHPEWYQTDYIHLVPAGGVAIAAWIHQAILDALAPPAAPQLRSRSRSSRRSSSGASARSWDVSARRSTGGSRRGRRRAAALARHRAGASPGEAAPPRPR